MSDAAEATNVETVGMAAMWDFPSTVHHSHLPVGLLCRNQGRENVHNRYAVGRSVVPHSHPPDTQPQGVVQP